MMSYTTLYGLFALMSLLLTNALILMARYIRHVKSPPTDRDFENLIREKEAVETQLAQEHRTIEAMKASMEQVESEFKRMEESLKVKVQELDQLKAGQA
jgi:predicted nuclease with TOPRIM domain